MTVFRAPKGTYDVVPPQSASWLAVREALSAPPRSAGYGFIDTPMFEDTALFVRGVGESTDVVTKEMYTFEDRGGRSLTLRPEGTAGVLRAIAENGLDRGPTAGQGLVHRPQLPVRTATVWSLPTAHAGRCRDRRIVRPGHRCRGHLAGVDVVSGARIESRSVTA